MKVDRKRFLLSAGLLFATSSGVSPQWAQAQDTPNDATSAHDEAIETAQDGPAMEGGPMMEGGPHMEGGPMMEGGGPAWEGVQDPMVEAWETECRDALQTCRAQGTPNLTQCVALQKPSRSCLNINYHLGGPHPDGGPALEGGPSMEGGPMMEGGPHMEGGPSQEGVW